MHNVESGNQLLNSIEIEDDLLLRVVRRPKVDLKESLQTVSGTRTHTIITVNAN